MWNLSKDYLSQVRKVFEPKTKRKFTDEEVENMANALINFGLVVQEFYRKKKELYGDKFDIWLKENILDGSNIDDSSKRLINNSSNQPEKKKSKRSPSH